MDDDDRLFLAQIAAIEIPEPPLVLSEKLRRSAVLCAQEALAIGSPEALRRARNQCQTALTAAAHWRRHEDIQATKHQAREGQRKGGRALGALRRKDSRLPEFFRRYDALVAAGTKPAKARSEANDPKNPWTDDYLRKCVNRRKAPPS